MKIANIELTKAKFVIIVVVVAAVAFAYFVLYRPLMKNVKSMYSECRSLETQVLEERNMIALAGKVVSGRVLMTEKDTSLAIDELAKHGKLIGINFISMVPKDIVKPQDSEYKILPVELEMEGTDQQFRLFLGTLDELKKSLIVVESFNIAPTEKDPMRISVKIVIDIYFSAKDVPHGQ